MSSSTEIAEREVRIEALGYDYAAREQEPAGPCNLCGSAQRIELSHTDRYGYPAVFNVCARCGLGMISPRLTSDEYARFYESVYRPLVSAYHGRRIDAETVQEDQREYTAELAGFLRRNLPGTPKTLMDIGGSTGVVAQILREELGCECTVLDPAPDELAVAAELGMETIEGFAEDYDPGERSWDLVLLCQTIDHLLDVRATLEAMRRMMGSDGHAFVDILDVGFMMRRRGSIEGAIKIDHPYYLTRDTALAYFALCGMVPIAEHTSHNGHWGFVLQAGEPREVDWGVVHSAAERFLADAWNLRATAR